MDDHSLRNAALGLFPAVKIPQMGHVDKRVAELGSGLVRTVAAHARSKVLLVLFQHLDLPGERAAPLQRLPSLTEFCPCSSRVWR